MTPDPELLIMNLAQQARDDACAQWGEQTGADRYYDYNYFDRRYAELILEECARVITAWKGEPFPFSEDLAVRLIKTHFGVKS
jgi:hypothetical protein